MGELTKEEEMELRLQLDIKDGAKKAIYGFLAFAIGGIITWVTLASTSSYYIILWGAILFGFIYMVVGIYRYLTSKHQYNKLMRDRDSSSGYSYKSTQKKQEIQEMIGEPKIFSKKAKIILIVVLCLIGIAVAGIFTGYIDFPQIDESFTLTGSGSPPSYYTLIDGYYWEIYLSRGDIVTIDASVDGAWIIDFIFEDKNYNNIPSLCAENSTSLHGTWEVTSSGTYTFGVWNSQNYREVNGHVRIDW